MSSRIRKSDCGSTKHDWDVRGHLTLILQDQLSCPQRYFLMLAKFQGFCKGWEDNPERESRLRRGLRYLVFAFKEALPSPALLPPPHFAKGEWCPFFAFPSWHLEIWPAWVFYVDEKTTGPWSAQTEELDSSFNGHQISVICSSHRCHSHSFLSHEFTLYKSFFFVITYFFFSWRNPN